MNFSEQFTAVIMIPTKKRHCNEMPPLKEYCNDVCIQTHSYTYSYRYRCKYRFWGDGSFKQLCMFYLLKTLYLAPFKEQFWPRFQETFGDVWRYLLNVITAAIII